jgi:AhpD family alkylhydroperoxidase
MEAKEFFEKFTHAVSEMNQKMPDMMNGFTALFAKVMKDNALKVHEKELIALGIAVAMQCTPCIRLHVKKCFEAGATNEQILEAASVAVMMAGGPAYTHVPIVLETMQALEAE